MTVRAIVTGLSLCIAAAPALAQVQCGDTITDRVVMTEDLSCSGFDPALTIAGGTLLMQGHTLWCDWEITDGIRLQGRGSILTGGTIAACGMPLVLTGSGSHAVRDVEIKSDPFSAVYVGSDRNTITRLRFSPDNLYWTYVGASISGNHNTISNSEFKGKVALTMNGNHNMLMDNELTGGFAGATVSGTNHILQRNVINGSDFFALGVSGSGHRIQGNMSNHWHGPNAGTIGFQISSTKTVVINNEVLFHAFDIYDSRPDCGDTIYRANRIGTANQDCVYGPRPGRPVS